MVGRGLKKSNQVAAQQRADNFFDIYIMLGEERSLTKLQDVLADGGLQVSLNTLKNYSSNFNWQLRLQTAHDTAMAQKAEETAKSLEGMNTRQANLGGLAQSLAGRNLRNSFMQMEANPEQIIWSPADIARMMTEGARLERLARGEVTSRSEARIQAYSVMVNQIVGVFAEVANIYDLPQQAIDEFVRRADVLVDNALTEGEESDKSESD